MATAPQRRMHAQIAANTRWAMEPDRTAATQPARDARLARFEDQVDPRRELSASVRRERAVALRRAHMQSLALRSSRKRAAA